MHAAANRRFDFETFNFQPCPAVRLTRHSGTSWPSQCAIKVINFYDICRTSTSSEKRRQIPTQRRIARIAGTRSSPNGMCVPSPEKYPHTLGMIVIAMRLAATDCRSEIRDQQIKSFTMVPDERQTFSPKEIVDRRSSSSPPTPQPQRQQQQQKTPLHATAP